MRSSANWRPREVSKQRAGPTSRLHAADQMTRCRVVLWRCSILLMLGLLVQSCAPSPRLIRRNAWEPTADVARMLRQGSVTLPGVQDLTAAAQIRLTTEEGPNTASASFQYLPPDIMRIDVRGPLFQHVLTAVLDADTLWSLAGGRLSRQPTRDGLADLLQIDLRGQDPRAAMLGLVAPVSVSDSLQVDYPRADRAVAIVRHGDGSERHLWVDLLSGFVVREEGIDRFGARRWRRLLSDYVQIGEGEAYLPRRVQIESDQRRLEIHYDEWRVDRGLSRQSFYKGIDF